MTVCPLQPPDSNPRPAPRSRDRRRRRGRLRVEARRSAGQKAIEETNGQMSVEVRISNNGLIVTRTRRDPKVLRLRQPRRTVAGSAQPEGTSPSRRGNEQHRTRRHPWNRLAHRRKPALELTPGEMEHRPTQETARTQAGGSRKRNAPWRRLYAQRFMKYSIVVSVLNAPSEIITPTAGVSRATRIAAHAPREMPKRPISVE